MIKEDPYTGMQYISCYHPDEEDTGPTAEERVFAAPVAGFFTLLFTLIGWLAIKLVQWVTTHEEYERAKQQDYSDSIQALNAKCKTRGTGVRARYIWEDEKRKWVKVDV